jgi:glutamate/tyrosine decarboxylase-like PLP-dependent enzyme
VTILDVESLKKLAQRAVASSPSADKSRRLNSWTPCTPHYGPQVWYVVFRVACKALLDGSLEKAKILSAV